MNEVGVRELKNQATEIIREVREQQAEYIITYRGRPVARIVPVVEGQNYTHPRHQEIARAELEALWAEWDRLAEEIDEHWTSELSAVEALAKDRDA